jgi:hypothetical protein
MAMDAPKFIELFLCSLKILVYLDVVACNNVKETWTVWTNANDFLVNIALDALLCAHIGRWGFASCGFLP